MVQQLFAYHRISENRLLHSALFDRLDQTAVCDNGLDEFRERCYMEFLAVGDITDDTVVQICFHRVALADGIHSLRALHDGQTDVDAVAVEDAGKALGNDHRDAGGLDAQRCVLTGGAAAEVGPGHDDVAGLDGGSEIRVDVLHCVGGQLLRVCDIQLTCGDDNVGIDIIAVLENLAFCVHGMCFLPYFRSSGAQI